MPHQMQYGKNSRQQHQQPFRAELTTQTKGRKWNKKAPEITFPQRGHPQPFTLQLQELHFGSNSKLQGIDSAALHASGSKYSPSSIK
ncbi:hypothetical protein Nepgr_005352 [Nepenthes gracilis]|uniref:Uncharacterized protein n=1 Tax=Nepenthes gracilis TaxID=150966 RepID=A0AAD3S309_NEPGR|nr:hypothetical protein Nepgr_005352 [Nepenthes gracilis]